MTHTRFGVNNVFDDTFPSQLFGKVCELINIINICIYIIIKHVKEMYSNVGMAMVKRDRDTVNQAYVSCSCASISIQLCWLAEDRRKNKEKSSTKSKNTLAVVINGFV